MPFISGKTEKSNKNKGIVVFGDKRRVKMKHKERDTPVIVIPKGYELEDFLDFDGEEFGGGEPTYTEEVKIAYER